ncbi:MAG: DUF115 domain-containing protein [Candidatus Pacebacteria bacterium]|nr:DUF115 domain-containing protein [Candidatus Paceibacterota bacterium]
MNLIKVRNIWLETRACFPSFIRDNILYLGNALLSQKDIKRNKELKEIHSSQKRCFIIGNGPSIRSQDLTLLKNETVFVVNSFYLHKDFDKIQPEYYTVIDPDYFREKELSIKWMKNLKEKAKNCTFFFPYWSRPFIEKNNFQAKKIYYLAMARQIKEKGRFQAEIDKQIPSLINVVLPSLLIARYMGFKKIYLLGCDHDWLAQPIEAYPTHFYKKDPLYPGVHETYESSLENTLKLFKSYRSIKEKFKDTKIYNATPGGFLDVFERADYESVLKNK